MDIKLVEHLQHLNELTTWQDLGWRAVAPNLKGYIVKYGGSKYPVVSTDEKYIQLRDKDGEVIEIPVGDELAYGYAKLYDTEGKLVQVDKRRSKWKLQQDSGSGARYWGTDMVYPMIYTPVPIKKWMESFLSPTDPTYLRDKKAGITHYVQYDITEDEGSVKKFKSLEDANTFIEELKVKLADRKYSRFESIVKGDK